MEGDGSVAEFPVGGRWVLWDCGREGGSNKGGRYKNEISDVHYSLTLIATIFLYHVGKLRQVRGHSQSYRLGIIIGNTDG